MKILSSPSPHFGDRRPTRAAGGARACLILLHYTDTPDAAAARALMQDPQHQASAHFLIDTDGTIEELVPVSRRAWHAGKSWWAGEEDINSLSIGIELQNSGHRGGRPPYPAVQISALVRLCRRLTEEQQINPEAVLGHSDVAPARKQDPGEHFPWQDLARAGFGYWPEGAVQESTVQGGQDTPESDLDPAEKDHSALLSLCGYDPRLDDTCRLIAFQRHFVPESFFDATGAHAPGRLCLLTRRRLLCAARHALRRGGALAFPPAARTAPAP